MDNIVEFHFLLSTNFLNHTDIPTLKSLYDCIKTASIFCAYHPHEDSDHVHIVTEDNIASKGQKIQNLVNKIRRKLSLTDVQARNFSDNLKLVNYQIEKKDRIPLAKQILENGMVSNAHAMCLSKPTAFSTLIVSAGKTINTSQRQAGCLSCIMNFTKHAIVKSGLKDDGDYQRVESEILNENENEGESSSEDEFEEPTAKKKTLSKADKWMMLERDIDNANAINMKQFYLRVHPSKFKTYFCQVIA